MLTISKISSAGANYYGKDNYYTRGEEQAGQWFGLGAQRLGLTGAVNNDTFDAMLKGNFEGIELGRREGGQLNHHPGWDHTLSAPKSVSMLALLGKDKRLIKAHDKAVDYTLHYIEDKLAESRVRRGEVIQSQKTTNIMVAKFRHDISRAKDPQLHTHACILNATFGGNGALRSLDSPVFYEHKMLMGAIYQSRLATLVQEIGYSIEIKDNGTFDIKGVDQDLMVRASKRRADIILHQKQQGTMGAISAQHAALITRPEKQQLSHLEKHQLWHHDFGDKSINQLVKFSQQTSQPPPNSQQQIKQPIKQQRAEATQAVESAIKHLSENESVFKTIDIAREAIVTSLGKTTPTQIKHAINEKIKNAQLLHAKTTEIKILNNQAKSMDKRAYTTPALIQQEKLTLKIMQEGRGQIKPIVDSVNSVGSVNSVNRVAKGLSLNRAEVFTQGQTSSATAILTTKDRFINIQGFAGVGKTFMLQEIKEQADKRNINLVGMAPSGAAANLLAKETGIETKTVQKHLMEGLQNLNQEKQSQQSKQPPKQRQLWLIDEASFISTKQALAISKLATKQNAQVVLLGDKKQLAGVEAGKPFATAQNMKYGLTTIKMNEIIRQKDSALKQAIYSATKGNIKDAFARMDKHIIQVQDKKGRDLPILRREMMAKSYLAMGKQARETTLVISPANEDRFNVNNHIRDGLKQQKELAKSSIQTTNLVNKNLTHEAKTKSYNYHKSNVVRFGRANKRLGIEKDSYFSIKSINHDINSMTLIRVDNQHKPQQILWNPKKQASKNAEIYFQNKRELNKGEVLFWRRTALSKNTKRRTNEKIKVLSLNKRTQNIKYVDLSTGESHSMNLNEFKNKHWEYAYCLTAHQAQGQTSDKVIINLESWRGKLSNQQAFYVEISRAKAQAIIFTDDKKKIQRQLTTKTGEKESALAQTTDLRAQHLDDIIKKQQGLKTNDEMAIEKQQFVKQQTQAYIQSLSPKQQQQLETDFRKTLPHCVLKGFDESYNKQTKQVYQGLIEIYTKDRLSQVQAQEPAHKQAHRQEKQQTAKHKQIDIGIKQTKQESQHKDRQQASQLTR